MHDRYRDRLAVIRSKIKRAEVIGKQLPGSPALREFAAEVLEALREIEAMVAELLLERG